MSTRGVTHVLQGHGRGRPHLCTGVPRTRPLNAPRKARKSAATGATSPMSVRLFGPHLASEQAPSQTRYRDARWLVFYGCFAGRGDRLEASERVTWVAVTREFVGLL